MRNVQFEPGHGRVIGTKVIDQVAPAQDVHQRAQGAGNAPASGRGQPELGGALLENVAEGVGIRVGRRQFGVQFGVARQMLIAGLTGTQLIGRRHRPPLTT